MSRKLIRENKKRVRRKKIRIVILAILAYVIFQLFYWGYRESLIKEENEIFDIQKVVKIDTKPIAEKVNIVNQYEGYDVSAELLIPKINLDTFILDKYTKEAMDICPTRFSETNANEIGNYCITGHNYKKEKMFSDLLNLEVGDELYLLDNKNGKYKYIVYDIHKVKPDNTNDLKANTEGKRVVTLITCVNYSDLRLVVKAIEC